VGVWAGESPVKVTEKDLESLKPVQAKPEQPNPLDKVADEMIEAQVRLKRGRTDTETQQSQVNAIRILDKLIEIAKQQQEQQQQQQQQQQQEREKEQRRDSKTKPQNTQRSARQEGVQRAKRSREAGAGGKAATGDAPAGGKGIEWGNLPPRAREEYEQILKEDFPEAYKRLLEQYYQNLSD